MDRVRRCGHEYRVTGLAQHPHQVREPFLGTDRVDHLSVGIEIDIETVLIQIGECRSELGKTAACRVAVILRVLGSLNQLFHGDLRGRKIRVAEPKIDHVLAGATCFHLQRIDDGEDVRGEPGDSTEFHTGRLVSRQPDAWQFHPKECRFFRRWPGWRSAHRLHMAGEVTHRSPHDPGLGSSLHEARNRYRQIDGEVVHDLTRRRI